MHQYLEVRVVKLEPMRVACLTAYGDTPELTAWSALLHWARDRELLETYIPPRFFGRDVDPLPGGRADHGYEVWMTVGRDLWSDHVVEVNDFKGGLYAVTHVKGVENIFPTWQRFEEWVENSNFHFSTRPCLEEHIQFMDLMAEDFEVDLYMPIEE
ncbi:MAG: hypothetical protein BroJett018_26530 [Chloroflexota bacterium]|nr:MAG: hypothetical protein BroJett018_26530 [Chloroflexota bacterium]